jgi:hypothetical protein
MRWLIRRPRYRCITCRRRFWGPRERAIPREAQPIFHPMRVDDAPDLSLLDKALAAPPPSVNLKV